MVDNQKDGDHFLNFYIVIRLNIKAVSASNHYFVLFAGRNLILAIEKRVGIAFMPIQGLSTFSSTKFPDALLLDNILNRNWACSGNSSS